MIDVVAAAYLMSASPSAWEDFIYYEVCDEGFSCYISNIRAYPEPRNSRQHWPSHFPAASGWYNGNTLTADGGVDLCCTPFGICYPKITTVCGVGTVAVVCESGTSWPDGTATCWDFTPDP